MTRAPVLRGSLLPLLLLGTGSTNRCRLPTESGTGELRVSGTVHFIRAERGCWQLQTEDGRRYELWSEQAPADLLRDGAEATVVGEPAEGWDTGCQVGMPLQVRRIVSIEMVGG
jgi:hypothetical protein